MKLFSRFLFCSLTASLSLTACHRAAEDTEPFGTSMSYTQGVFSEGKTLAQSETPLHADCGADAGQIDSRLKPGMAFETTYKSINGMKGNQTLAVRARIISVDSQHIEEKVMPVTLTGMAGGQIGNEEPMVCSFDNGSRFSCTQPSFIAEANTNVGDYVDCQLAGEKAGITDQRAVSGKFKLVSGKTVDAIMMTTTYEGELFCGKTAFRSSKESLGAGERVDVLITSKDVPAEGAVTICGGATLFSAKVFKNKLGRVMFGSSQERTLIP